uniref:Uncharacterized protein n=1 Tax=Opuntia streptacantha TaxID=393608 RepID=A0A7C8ZGY2_OPUST
MGEHSLVQLYDSPYHPWISQLAHLLLGRTGQTGSPPSVQMKIDSLSGFRASQTFSFSRCRTSWPCFCQCQSSLLLWHRLAVQAWLRLLSASHASFEQQPFVASTQRS